MIPLQVATAIPDKRFPIENSYRSHVAEVGYLRNKSRG